jgi:adenylate kinase family enzyme
MKTEVTEIIKNAKRIIVIGSSCAGKTTFCTKVAKELDLKHIELDALYWLENWQGRDKQEFREIVGKEITAGKWIIDGNYHTVRDLVWPEAELVIWLNYDFPFVFKRALYRTLKRIITREEIYSGNRETFRKAFFHRDSLLWWIITTFNRRRREFPLLIKLPEHSHLKVIEFRKAGEADKLF